MSAPLSPAERAVVARFETAEPAPESFRSQVEEAMYRHAIWGFTGTEVACECSCRTWMTRSEYTRHLAAAAIAVMRGQQ